MLSGMKIVLWVLLVLGLAMWLRPRDKVGWIGLCMSIFGAAGLVWNARKRQKVAQGSLPPSYPSEDAWERLSQGKMR